MNAERVDRSDLSPQWAELVAAAEQARVRAYAPYSHFAVGAAVCTPSGAVYAGCNIENASYGLTVCAERVAVWQAVAAGETALSALAVYTPEMASPCGACRQVLAEFAPDLPILLADAQGHVLVTSLRALLPMSFTLQHSGDKTEA